jgi:DNA polymerase III epsilon subunit-like protein
MTDHVLFFDTETTGLPKNWKAPMADLDNWPRVIQLAWLVADLSGETLTSHEILIKPNGWEIPKEDFWITHGFDTELSLRAGQPLEAALSVFVEDMQACEYMVSHNLDFDRNVLGAEMLRLGVKSPRKLTRICTKEASTEYCKLPFDGQRAWLSKQKGSGKQYKWPKLQELHLFLFGKDFEGAHQAGGDVAALKACFFELLNRGVIKLQPLPNEGTQS